MTAAARSTVVPPLRLAEPVERELPAWPDGERVVLGAVLLGAELGAPLDPADFHRDDHATLARLIEELRTAGAPVDLVTVTERVAHSPDPQRYGGVPYVVELVDHAPPANAGLPYYIGRLRALRLLRTAALVGSQLDRVCREADGDPDMVVSSAAGDITAALADLGSLLTPDEQLARAVELLNRWGFDAERMRALWAGMRSRRGAGSQP